MNAKKIQRISVAIATLALGACGTKPSTPPDEVLNQPNAGVVELDISPDGPTVSQQIVATFLSAPSDLTCNITTSGVCTLIDCPSGRAGLQPSNAGNIAVTNGSTSVSLIPFSASGGYSQSPIDASVGLIFSAGTSVTVAGKGGPAPAFSVQLTGPSAVIVTQPSDMALSIDRTMDLAVAWTGSTTGDVVFELKGLAPENNPILDCAFSGKDTSGTVPSTALMLLAANNYEADVFSRTRATANPDDWYVQVNADAHGGLAGGVAYKRSASVH